MTPLQSPALRDVAGISHGFFGRQGGVSGGVYASLNGGFGSDDTADNVRENRKRIATHLGTREADLITVYQTHSAEAVIVTAPWSRADAPQADAMATNVRGIALGVLAADCAPVLFVDPQAGVIGSAHAGWKGALGGVVESTVLTMEKLGADRGRIRAAIGPCIGQSSYEVGSEFPARFIEHAAGNAAFFCPALREGYSFFDLPGFVKSRLSALGLAAVERMNVCTYEHGDFYFSFRRTTHRNESDYGRNLSAIMLKP